MRRGQVTIQGVDYPLVFSTRVLVEMEDRGITLQDLTDDGGKKFRATITILSLMMEAGTKAARKAGETPPDPLSVDDLMDQTELEDVATITEAIGQTAFGGRRVEAVPPKNAKATQRTAR